ncbi:MAG: hypothetical protein FWG87_07845 [Defluviitaleaceae bacterium]|nr:hypothetical protein [Defluviitaleaceae bacterium]
MKMFFSKFSHACCLLLVKHGFNGFSRILRILSCVNPRSIYLVGDGFIRPEVTSLCVGRRAVLSKKTT